MSARPTAPIPPPRKQGKQGFLLWLLVVVLCVGALVGTYFLFVEAPPPKHLVIATGGKAGAYYAFAQKYAADLAKEGLTLEVRETKGSVENLKLLRDEHSGVDIAIIQSGVASAEDAEHLRALGSLYREPLWVFYRGDQPFDRLGELAGKRIGVGPVGSGTNPIAVQLLAANGLTDTRANLVPSPVSDAAKALQKGDLDAAFFVAAKEAGYVKDLLADEHVRLMSFVQHEAYHRKFRFLSEVTLPAGLLNLGKNLPPQDIALVAPTAMLVVRKDFHPALVPMFLGAATRIHAKGDELSNPDEFPSTSYTDLPISEDARHFYKTGPPMLQRMLPFWLASLVDRLKVMLIPLIVLLMPLIRAAPPLAHWRTRRKIYRWYAALRDIDLKVMNGLAGPDLDAEIAHLRELDQAIVQVDVPLGYMEELYHLRLHLSMLQEKLARLRAEQ